MGKFKNCLTETGDAIISKRAENLSSEVLDAFKDEKRRIEKEIRSLNNEITSMEDLSVKSTQTLIVGENLNVGSWVTKRVDIELKLRDLKVELETVNKLIKDYFDDED